MAKTTKEFGIEWQVTVTFNDSMHHLQKYYNSEIGEFVITNEAFDILKCISNSEKYKVPSLVFEHCTQGKIYSISTKDDIVQWQDDKYTSINVDEFLGRFPLGYAMGLSIPVIWTCKNDEEEIKKIHFDTRQYNTIFWKDENDLYERLRKRITAIMGLRDERTSP